MLNTHKSIFCFYQVWVHHHTLKRSIILPVPVWRNNRCYFGCGNINFCRLFHLAGKIPLSGNRDCNLAAFHGIVHGFIIIPAFGQRPLLISQGNSRCQGALYRCLCYLLRFDLKSGCLLRRSCIVPYSGYRDGGFFIPGRCIQVISVCNDIVFIKF